MKNWRTLLPVFAVLLLVLVLAGCKGKGDTPKHDHPEGEHPATEQPAEEKAEKSEHPEHPK